MDDYDYSMDAYWPDGDLSIEEMEVIDQMARVCGMILEIGSHIADA